MPPPDRLARRRRRRSPPRRADAPAAGRRRPPLRRLSTQSLARGTGSIETDYLNGEIVLLGRLHGVPVPANAYLVDLSARLVRDGLKPGAVAAAEIEAGLGRWRRARLALAFPPVRALHWPRRNFGDAHVQIARPRASSW